MMTFEQQVTPLEPAGDPALYKTYAISSPLTTHTRVARCSEVECPNYLRGWRTVLDLSTDLGKRQARYIREKSGRHFEVITEKPLLTLEFRAGQECFSEHRVPLHREPLYLVKGGDYRGNPLGVPTVQRSERDWVDDFGDHQQKIKEAHERG
jgi:hypothetical protein